MTEHPSGWCEVGRTPKGGRVFQRQGRTYTDPAPQERLQEAAPAPVSHWYNDHGNLIILTDWMAANGYEATEIADMIRKPWHFTAEMNEARAALESDNDDA